MKINFKQLSVELLVILIGVPIALAADNWREYVAERTLEEKYLFRFQADMSLDFLAFESNYRSLKTALSGTQIIISYLDGQNSGITNNLLVDEFTNAAMTGSTFSSNLSNKTTYNEMLSTGILNLIENFELRSEINNYYAASDRVIERRSQLTNQVWIKYRQLTGVNSGVYVNRGERPNEEASNRLLLELKNNDFLIQDFRLLQANISNFMIMMPEFFALSESLQMKISEEISNT